MNWTDTPAARLRDLWLTHTARQIADILGCTESAVSNKAGKLKLPSKAKPKKPPRPEGSDFNAVLICTCCHQRRSLVGHRVINGAKVCRACAAGETPASRYVPREPVVTVCRGFVGYDVRFQVPPGETVFGRFSMAGPGRDLDGRPWGARA